MQTDIGTVWEQRRYDGGWYACKVERKGEFGLLTIRLEGVIPHKLHEERVKCDRADPDKWRLRCEAVINDPDMRTVEAR